MIDHIVISVGILALCTLAYAYGTRRGYRRGWRDGAEANASHAFAATLEVCAHAGVDSEEALSIMREMAVERMAEAMEVRDLERIAEL